LFELAHRAIPIFSFFDFKWELLRSLTEENCMAHKVTYWFSTGLLAALSIFAGFSYLSGNPQAVQGFAHVGYPQQLRIILGIAKPLGAITLLVPGFVKLKEWAYAGFTFAWISAFFAHYLAKDGPVAFMPLILLVLLGVSYMTRPRNRVWAPGATLAGPAKADL
jgi:DoxX-like family